MSGDSLGSSRGEGSLDPRPASSWVATPEPNKFQLPKYGTTQGPIAIVGMALQFPGAQTADGLWAALQDGLNTVEQIPRSRFDVSVYSNQRSSSTRSTNVTNGNFIRDPDAFDNMFFGISPREARSMDPQQRLLLRIAHDALENAGYSAGATPTFDPATFATFIGVATHDYAQNLRDDVDVYYSTGTLQAFLSGRVAYAFGFGGPSIVLDTACSSSIVAIHQACRALAAGDCMAALAGGVNVITSPDMYLGLARGHFLSETGQCRPWDASADGYSRSEGCGLFVLKRFNDAIAENDRILAVIRGIEINQSGNARSITHPHIPTQIALLEKLISSANLGPYDISVAECHGTGTQAGDPAELEAIRKVLAVGRAHSNPLHITSIKANIGHAEAASGAASLAKLILMMRERSIPRQISFERLNPRIPHLSIDNVRINTVQVPWVCEEQNRRLALLNNFGAAGSNSALILEEYVPPSRDVASVWALLVGISCKTFAAAEARLRTYITHFEDVVHDNVSLQDFAYSATARRQLYSYRLAVSGTSKDTLLANLRAAKAVEVRPSDRVVFVFSGQGSHYLGMGGDLYRHLPAFAQIVDECDRKLLALGSPGVLNVFQGTACPPDVGDATQFKSLQAALFVLEYALARTWMSWGIEPCAAVGHSFGEFAALAISGSLSLEDALKIVVRRAEVISAQCTANSTGMTSVRAPVDRFASMIGRHPFLHLEVCCYNSESSFVVGGDLQELKIFEGHCATSGVRYTRLDVPYAYHSATMDPVSADLTVLSDAVHISPPAIPVLSNVAGAMVLPGGSGTFGPTYFARHCREPARFQQGIVDLTTHVDLSSVAAFIEVGPHPTTLPLLRGFQADGAPLLVPSLRKAAPGLETLCATLAQLYCTSVPVQWRKVFADLAPGARLVDLPAYPFAQTKFWVPYKEEPLHERAPLHREQALPLLRFSLLDRCLRSSATDAGIVGVFETDLSSLEQLIQGHQVGGVPLCPASVYVEMAISATASVLGSGSTSWNKDGVLDLTEVSYPKPLVYTPGRLVRLQVKVSLSSAPRKGVGSFTVSSVSEGHAEPKVHCEGSFKTCTADDRLSELMHSEAVVKREVQALRQTGTQHELETFNTRTIYDLLFPSVVTYSDIYRTVKTMTINPASSTAYAIIQMPKAAPPGTFTTHPVFVDTLFHVAGFLVNFTRGFNGHDVYICSQANKVQLVPQVIDLSAQYGVYAAVTRDDGGVVAVDAYVIETDDPRQRIIARLKRVCFRRLASSGFNRVLQAAAGVAAVPRSYDEGPASFAASSVPESFSDRAAPKQAAIQCGERDLKGEVLGIIAETAGIPAGSITAGAHLSHLGIDSLMLWEVADRLRAIVPKPASGLSAHALSSATTAGELVELVAEQFPTNPALRASSTDDSVLTLYEDVVDKLPKTEALQEEVEQPVSVSTVDVFAVKSVLSSALCLSFPDITEDADLRNLGLNPHTSLAARNAFQARYGVTIGQEMLSSCVSAGDLIRAFARASSVTATEVPPLKDALPEPTKGHEEAPSPPSTFETLSFDRGMELVRLQSAPMWSAPAPPLILVHDGSGTVGGYGRLASLGRDVWAFRNLDFSFFFDYSEQRKGEELVDMARAYRDALTSTILNGSCYIGGWSFGGVVAFELARQLVQSGLDVRGLVLIDAPAPQTLSPFPERLIRAVAGRITGTSGRSGGSRVFVDQMLCTTHALVSYNPIVAVRLALRAVYLRAVDAVDLTAFDADDGIGEDVRAFLTKSAQDQTTSLWEEVLEMPKLEILDVPGDHFEVFHRDNVYQLCEQLKKGLDMLSHRC